MRDSPTRRRSGFTFIEMLVVFVVFGAVMAISVPAVGDTLRRNRVAKIGAVLSADIEQAFAIAARQREPVRMVVDRTNKDTIDIMPNGLATDTLHLALIIRTTGGATYRKAVRVSKGGLVRMDNR